MTPYNHHTSDTYLTTYTADLRRDLQQAHRRRPGTVRRTVARRLVQLGAWMLPEKPDIVSGTILVLELEPEDRAVREAA